MSLMIKGMEMPKQTEVQTDKGTLKLWTIRNWEVGQDVQFGAAKIPCDLSFNHDGTIHLSVLGRKYSLTDVPAPHGRLIDADAHIQSLKENQCGERCRKNHDCVNCGIGMYIRIVENEPTILEAEE